MHGRVEFQSHRSPAVALPTARPSMVTAIRYPPHSECPGCRQPVTRHSKSIVIQEGTQRTLFHQTCYRRYRKEAAKAQRRLTQELRRANAARRLAAAAVPVQSVSPAPAPPSAPTPPQPAAPSPVAAAAAARRVPPAQRLRRATPCPVPGCGAGRSSVFFGMPSGPHIRRCLAGHYVYWVRSQPVLLTADEAKQLKAGHPMGKRTGSTPCPLCGKLVPFGEMPIHVQANHGSLPQRPDIPRPPDTPVEARPAPAPVRPLARPQGRRVPQPDPILAVSQASAQLGPALGEVVERFLTALE